MANLIKPGEVKVVAKNNEILVNIALDLNIKLDGNVTNITLDKSQPFAIKEEEEDKINWEVPNFESKKINFGKNK
jgi:uncharacterized protein (UPF0333 family)